MKHIIATAFITGMITLFASSTFACFCLIPDVPKAVERASAVFVGEVVDIAEPSTSDEHAPLPGKFFVIKFKVQKSWKGVTSSEVEILSAQGKYGCFAFPPVRKGEKYLVYADEAYHDGGSPKGWLIITTCNRTAPIPESGTRFDDRFSPLEFNRKDASEDLKELEKIKIQALGFTSIAFLMRAEL
jgi:hypothetical protein